MQRRARRRSGSHVRGKRNGRGWSPPACASAGMGRAAASVCAPAYGGGCMCRCISCMRHAVAGGSVGVAVFFDNYRCSCIQVSSCMQGRHGHSNGDVRAVATPFCLCAQTHLSRRFMVIISLRAPIILSSLF